jgi:hypothetical protein
MSSDRIPKMILKYQPKRENKFRKTLEKMEGFSFVTPVTRLNAPNTGKEDDDDDDDQSDTNPILYITVVQLASRGPCTARDRL